MADSDAADAAKAAADKAAQAAAQSAKRAADAAQGLTGGIAGQAGGIADKATGAVSGAAGNLTGAAGDAIGSAKGRASSAAGKAAGVGGALGSAAGSLGSKGASTVTGAASGVGSLAKNASSGISTDSGKGGGWRSFVPPNGRGKFPWKWRWLGLPLILGACLLTGIWGWGKMESGLNERALAHLACDGIPTDDLNLDWSYRSVTVNGDANGELPAGVTADQVERIIRNGPQVDPDTCVGAGDDPGVYDVKVPAVAAAAAAIAALPDPDPTATAVPEPTATAVPEPTATAVPEPTATTVPEPTPEPTAVPQIAALAATAAFDGANITLTGEVANEAQRQSLLDAAVASVGEDNVVDQLTIADGDPSDTSDARVSELATVIASFGGPNVVEGQASATDDALTYDLVAPSDDAAAALDLAGSGTVEVARSPQPSFTG